MKGTTTALPLSDTLFYAVSDSNEGLYNVWQDRCPSLALTKSYSDNSINVASCDKRPHARSSRLEVEDTPYITQSLGRKIRMLTRFG